MNIRSKLRTAARILMGAPLLVFSLNGLLHFMPLPPMSPAAGAFMGALAATGYMFPLIKLVEVVSALLLLSGRYVPLALTLFAPVLVNIVAFHATYAPAGLALPLLFVAIEIYLAWTYRSSFTPLFRAKSESSATRASRISADLAHPSAA